MNRLLCLMLTLSLNLCVQAAVPFPTTIDKPAPLNLKAFVGTWRVSSVRDPLVQTVTVRPTKVGYAVSVFGQCPKPKGLCEWGEVTVSETYPHGILPWDPKHPIAFVAFKQLDAKHIGFALFNVFNDKTHQENQLFQTLLVSA